MTYITYTKMFVSCRVPTPDYRTVKMPDIEEGTLNIRKNTSRKLLW